MSYRPTPLERAHATHLLVTYFNTPVDLANDHGEMRVSGRDAVPFLTSVSLCDWRQIKITFIFVMRLRVSFP
jgi:hypothetical protein